MTYYCGSCRDKGVLTQIPPGLIKEGYYRCPVEQARFKTAFLEAHRVPPVRDRQLALNRFLE